MLDYSIRKPVVRGSMQNFQAKLSKWAEQPLLPETSTGAAEEPPLKSRWPWGRLLSVAEETNSYEIVPNSILV